jgi:hypothetical protein
MREESQGKFRRITRGEEKRKDWKEKDNRVAVS